MSMSSVAPLHSWITGTPGSKGGTRERQCEGVAAHVDGIIERQAHESAFAVRRASARSVADGVG